MHTYNYNYNNQTNVTNTITKTKVTTSKLTIITNNKTKLLYSRKVWWKEKFGESQVIHQTKTIQISTYNYNLLAESIHSPNFFLPNAQNE